MRFEKDIAHVTAWCGAREFEFLIDRDDWAKVGARRWRIARDRRPISDVVSNGKKGAMPLPRYLMDPPAKMVVDHISHDTLDNRRQNLRVCTPAQNAYNKHAAGVVALPRKHRPPRYRAQISFTLEDGTHVALARHFVTHAEAIAQRAAWEVKYFGSYRYQALEEAIPPSP